MGALAPVAPWTPEDDILLKNAVEAGASLESLAKGAVQFSRRYTVRELQERWHSLLYDPIVSEDASMSMIDFERSSSILPSKFNKFGNPKETKYIGGKRKSGSVRHCYYALRKRVCNEPFNNPMDLNFLVGPSNSNYVVEEPMSGNCIPPISDDFGLQSSEMGILPCDFSQNVMNTDDVEHTFQSGCQGTVEKHFPRNLDNGQEGISHSMRESLPPSAIDSHVEGLAPSTGFPVHSIFENDLEARPSTFGQLSNDQRVMGSELEDNNVFNSPVSESGASFHNVEYSSPLPGMPIWRNASVPALPIDVGFADKDIPTSNSFELPDDDGNKNIQNARVAGYDAYSDLKLKIEVEQDHLKSPNATAEVYLAELSNSLMNMSNEDELLFMDVDGKDALDKSYYDGLSSLLLNSPNEINHDQTTNAINAETVLPTDTMVDPPTACSGGLYEKGSDCGVGHLDCTSEAHSSPSASLNSQCPVKGDEPLFCTLNTEDPDIPSNDDVFLPPLSTMATMGYNFQDCINTTFSSTKDFTYNEKSGETQNLGRERKNHGQPRVLSGLHGFSERGEKHPVGGAGVNYRSSHSNARHLPSVSNVGSINGNSDAALPAVLKEENNEISRVNHLGENFLNAHADKPGFDSDNVRMYPPSAACDIKQEPDILASLKDHRLSQEGGTRGTFGVEQGGLSSTSDQEELSIDSEDDVPHFSDIEAMILDMDLDPEDQDLYSSEEVLKYQHVDTKKRIIRLEQGANAYMQRSTASHGALAVLYGRYSKHYIKKSEVLLGRATEDVIVDIDLGREGSGNKISRRQAIIKLDQDGFFSLKNLGKCSISINNKDVAPGHCLRLNSGCLIEIRGMPFIFESNPTRMKQYVDNVGKISHKQEYQS
ncbi:uncharacterized protein LOC111811415 isoform X1 [Cucurbita pepo subsp. pepo]|uniref:uncharacterized protein LOC111811415 isoform X1 n=2 Tax=Cucurbita pepo subsp. pepo TaxID=3664 RepID=UPI000C9D8771|nr:uncharacterized protein LOC111811415 isoform X1 [Cucurbita pepo subsp. pepo]XP_023554019.1 uncharacterized protein LOC111811415 isoform X1 [Cucurbita pepo subsp. pepo]